MGAVYILRGAFISIRAQPNFDPQFKPNLRSISRANTLTVWVDWGGWTCLILCMLHPYYPLLLDASHPRETPNSMFFCTPRPIATYVDVSFDAFLLEVEAMNREKYLIRVHSPPSLVTKSRGEMITYLPHFFIPGVDVIFLSHCMR